MPLVFSTTRVLPPRVLFESPFCLCLPRSLHRWLAISSLSHPPHRFPSIHSLSSLARELVTPRPSENRQRIAISLSRLVHLSVLLKTTRFAQNLGPPSPSNFPSRDVSICSLSLFLSAGTATLRCVPGTQIIKYSYTNIIYRV